VRDNGHGLAPKPVGGGGVWRTMGWRPGTLGLGPGQESGSGPGHPILYRTGRVGEYSRTFWLLKSRSMRACYQTAADCVAILKDLRQTLQILQWLISL